MEKPLVKSFSLDDKGPVVASLATSNVKNSKSYAKESGNTVFASFDETTGMFADEVLLHVGTSTIPAKNCTKQSSWVCAWENVGFDDATSMSIDTDTKDILGNSVAAAKVTDVVVDTTSPVIVGISVVALSGLTEAIEGMFKVGDKFFVEANLTDDNDISASGDFSKFITSASAVSGSCKKIPGDMQQCTWTTERINLAANNDIVLVFTDESGNQVSSKKTFTIVGLDSTEVPDLWKSTIACSPATIDRQTGSLVNNNVYCSVKLTLNSSKKASTISISPAVCDDILVDGKNTVDVSDYVEKIETFNAQNGSTSPFIKLVLKKKDFNIDNLSVSCSINIISKLHAANTITQNPEIENEKIFLQFYNLPLGELGDSVKQKIHDAKKEARDTLKFVDGAAKFMATAKKICQMIETMYKIAAVLYMISTALHVTETVCEDTVVGNLFGVCAAVTGIKTGVCQGQTKTSDMADGMQKTARKFCDFVTCKQTILWGADMNTWINEKAPIWLAPGRNYGSDNPQIDTLRGVQTGNYLDPQNNLLVATAFACVPGIITGLDKYRQIKCLYADCLENAVGKDGLPLTACENQKNYATCKYVTGEIFAIVPWTAFFDHWTGLLKQAFSNPFTIIGVAASIFCPCTTKGDAGARYVLCRGVRTFNLLADATENVNSFKENVKPVQNYCDRLDFSDLDAEEAALAAEDSEEATI